MEGLAPVRLNGTYGYINSDGAYAIPSRYDLALSFRNGIAKVYIDGKPYFINKKGQKLFEHPYKEITEFDNNSRAQVVTPWLKKGIINQAGKLIIDTIFSDIGPFNDGVAVVTGLNHAPYDRVNPRSEKGVIDQQTTLLPRRNNGPLSGVV